MNPNDISRLVLGTAQLGLNYGIANQTGAPSRSEAFHILECAWEAGVRHVDTAPGYRSEQIIGEFVKTHYLGREIKVLTKIPSMAGNNNWKHFALKSVENSLEELGTDKLKVVFLHAENDISRLLSNAEFFEDLRERFAVESLGVSAYDPGMVEQTMTAYPGLAYQFPYNILDRRFEAISMPAGKRYARSIFLQGLLASEHIHPNAPEAVKHLHHTIRAVSASQGVAPKQAAWTFLSVSDHLDYFLVGAETADQLKDLFGLERIAINELEILDKKWRKHISDEWLDPRKWT